MCQDAFKVSSESSGVMFGAVPSMVKLFLDFRVDVHSEHMQSMRSGEPSASVDHKPSLIRTAEAA